jgi:RNA polymerase sigma-B factor
MFIHVVSRPLSDVTHVPRSGVRALVDSIRRAGGEADFDIATAGDIGAAVTACGDQLLASWRHKRPEVVHAVGVVATLAALHVRPDDLPVVATFDENPSPARLEEELARQVDAILPLSTSEQQRWREAGVRSLPAGVMGVPAPATPMRTRPQDGHVVSLSTGPGLESLIRSMPLWGPKRLVLLGHIGEEKLRRLRAVAEELGVRAMIDHRPGLRGQARTAVWREALLLVAGADGARNGAHVLEAASHGVTSVAVARDAHLDHIVPGATGVLIEPDDGVRGLGEAVGELLGDPLRCRGMGSAAWLRLQALHEKPAVGQHLLSMYELVLGDPAPEPVRLSSTAPLTEEGTELALAYMPLARQLAHRYAGRGQRIDDLVQVASLGLVRAASRFDPHFGTEFHSFAVPTILGELRRHFRDHAWAARVPRSLQEVTLKVQRVSDELRSTHGKDATPAEVAEHLGLVEEEVLQAMQARGEAMSSKSLDHPMGEDGDEAFGDLVGDLDPDLDYVEMREAVRAALQQLPEREREILLMRFYGEQTQSETAQALGLSQVHVSRLITRTLAALRDHVLNDVPLPRSWQSEDGAEPGRRAA